MINKVEPLIIVSIIFFLLTGCASILKIKPLSFYYNEVSKKTTYTTRDQIKANLINYMLTNKGERVMNPEFGSNLRALLFQQIDDGDLDDMLAQIQMNVTTQFQTVQVKELLFHKSNEAKNRNEINFTMTYQVKILGIDDELQILLQ